MWSVGCILAELLGRSPLFPGKNFVHQLQLIFDVIGSPRAEEIERVKNKQARKFLDSIQGKLKVSFGNIFGSAGLPANTVLEGLLLFNASKRATAVGLLDYSYFRNLSYAKIPIADPLAPPCDFSFERESLSLTELRKEIAHEVAAFSTSTKRWNTRTNSFEVESALGGVAKTSGQSRRDTGKTRGGHNRRSQYEGNSDTPQQLAKSANIVDKNVLYHNALLRTKSKSTDLGQLKPRPEPSRSSSPPPLPSQHTKSFKSAMHENKDLSHPIHVVRSKIENLITPLSFWQVSSSEEGKSVQTSVSIASIKTQYRN